MYRVVVVSHLSQMAKPFRAVEKRILQLLHGRETRQKLTQIHGHFLRHGLHQSSKVLTHFISVCGSLNKTTYARLVFDHSQIEPDTALLNSMIKAYSLNGPFDQPVHLFSTMKRLGNSPDSDTFAPLLKSCSNLRDYRTGLCVWSQVLRSGFERYCSVQVGMIELSSRCYVMNDAQKLFDKMPRFNGHVIVWNLMVRGFCESGDIDSGLRLFRMMTERSVVSWNSMISCLARTSRDSEALELFDEMRATGFEPDEATVVTVLPICARTGDVDLGQQIHSYVDHKGLLRESVPVCNSLMDFYNKSGMIESAMDVFRRMSSRDVVTWNVMISGAALNGEGSRGVRLFEDMVGRARMWPNSSTLVAVLGCCTHSAGLVQKGREIFESMEGIFGIEPRIEHYGCMVDILGRNGFLDEAYELIGNMPMKANAVLWGSLLSSCRSHGNLKLARIAVLELIRMEPRNSGNYVLLSNIYAEEGRWDRVEKVRELMRQRCVKKEPGHSAVGLI